MTVHRFLVTGDEKWLAKFYILVCLLWNQIERRGQTILYTALDQDKEYGLKHAEKLGLTVQERTEANNAEEGSPWKIVVQGDSPGWVWTPLKENEETSPPNPGDVVDIDR